ncbi:hypothetical protein KPH14_001382 [Odynerus spinipes]|uniref:Uncharacterized protein n=1 Tax=Odynerus spinipes TaxID=1348599 RepID=A0AAD9VKQ7_9HYME|nr:hypothetical protein KPH14_001382 [Odynerus spinipes]
MATPIVEGSSLVLELWLEDSPTSLISDGLCGSMCDSTIAMSSAKVAVRVSAVTDRVYAISRLVLSQLFTIKLGSNLIVKLH